MLGANRSGEGGHAKAFEFMRIVEDKQGRISFLAYPGGKSPVAFPLVSTGSQQVVFENATNDYPQRILYRREGKKLMATVSKLDGGDPLTWTFKRP